MPASRSPHDDVTEQFPQVRPHDTRELPALDDPTEPVAAVAPTTEQRPVAPEAPTERAEPAEPVEPVEPARAAEPAEPDSPAEPEAREAPAGPATPPTSASDDGAPVAPTPPVAARPPARRTSGRPRPALVAALLVAAVTLGVLVGVLAGRDGGDDPAAAASPSASASPQRLDVQVSSVDPSGGSGFERDGDGWRTQTYTTPEFGNLKPGVGLLVDLGERREITAVTFDAGDSGATVGLRAADDPPSSGADLPPVGEDAVATGRTTLDASGAGAHRYWLVWVSRLGPRGDGYGATFGEPVVTAPAG